ncbi:MAG: hypothetical protein LBQ78_04815 [Tannerellaceae bacterium]|jgi:hypothetical protein|nr:hypothetical protein [Tannerellaceae bacterium]
MKTYQREILISAIALVVMSLTILSYIKSVEREKQSAGTDLFQLIAPAPDALLTVNRPSVFSRMVLTQPSLYSAFASELPPVFLSLIRESHEGRLLFSFHPEGVVCYVKANGRQVRAMEKKVLQKRFAHYAPLEKVKEGIAYSFYADTDGRFFGCYSYGGIWVGSYSRKLLEAISRRQKGNSLSIPAEIDELRHASDMNAPANILFPADGLNLYVAPDQLPEWRIGNRWLATDLFLSEGRFCCYGNLPYASLPAVYYQSMADTLSRRLGQLYPGIQMSFQINSEDNKLYYTGCAPF